jgi:hypothetical protein
MKAVSDAVVVLAADEGVVADCAGALNRKSELGRTGNVARGLE